MLRYQCRFDPGRQHGKTVEVRSVRRSSGSQRQRYTVQRNRMIGPDGFKPSEARATLHNIVFGVYFKPQSVSTACQCRVLILRLQAKADCQSFGRG